MRRCNFCYLNDIRKLAANMTPPQEVTTKPEPHTEAWPEGVSVYIGGFWACWMAKLPTECHCVTLMDDPINEMLLRAGCYVEQLEENQ